MYRPARCRPSRSTFVGRPAPHYVLAFLDPPAAQPLPGSGGSRALLLAAAQGQATRGETRRGGPGGPAATWFRHSYKPNARK